jgi:hypothetical protein
MCRVQERRAKKLRNCTLDKNIIYTKQQINPPMTVKRQCSLSHFALYLTFTTYIFFSSANALSVGFRSRRRQRPTVSCLDTCYLPLPLFSFLFGHTMKRPYYTSLESCVPEVLVRYWFNLLMHKHTAKVFVSSRISVGTHPC